MSYMSTKQQPVAPMPHGYVESDIRLIFRPIGKPEQFVIQEIYC